MRRKLEYNIFYPTDCKKIIIVKDSMKPHYNQYGVYIIGLYDFLLNMNSLDF